MKTARFVFALIVCLAGISSARSADDPAFGSKIDAWMEGSIMTLDADSHKFTVRGAQRPYATEYAKMVRDINDKTAKLTGADRDAKAADVRKSYADNLEKARTKERSKDSDFNFYVPADGMIQVHDETANYNRPSNTVTQPDTIRSTKEAIAMHALKDFHVGEYVVVGYESGVVKNTAFVIIRANKPVDMVPAGHKEADSTKTTADKVGDATKLDANTEQQRQIRKAIVEDKTLSTAAHNVTIDFHDGMFHLKGKVPTDAEKQAVEAKATSVAGQGKVMSHLEVGK